MKPNDQLQLSEVAKTLDTVVSKVTKIAGRVWIVLLLLLVGLLFFDWYVRDAHKGGATSPFIALVISTLGMAEGVLLSLLVTTTIAVFSRQLIFAYNHLRGILDARPIESLREEIEMLRRDLHARGEGNSVVQRFFPRYADVNWNELLRTAQEVHLCAFYFSKDWLRTNLPAFRDFLQRGGRLHLYLGSFDNYDSRFAEPASLTAHSIEKIIESATVFIKAKAEADNGTLSIKAVKRAITYMCGRVQSDMGHSFLFSPFSLTMADNAQPPLVILDENHASKELVNFVTKEIEHLQSSSVFPFYEKLRYITWDVPGSRSVFVSISLHCTARCAFCYIDSIVTSSIAARKIAANADLLVKEVIRHGNFIPTRTGTQIFVGGFSDPFARGNAECVLDVLDILDRSKSTNVVHFATKHVLQKDLRKRLDKHKHRIIINFSVSSLSAALEAGAPSLEHRLEWAAELVSEGFAVALYVRPVLPEITVNDALQLAQKARAVGIAHVTVGGLYKGPLIEEATRPQGLDLSRFETTNKKFVLDQNNILHKVKIDEVEQVKKAFQDLGFRVFRSSREIAAYFADNPWPPIEKKKGRR